jgi:translation elongation factor EF-Tu-like GTPase
MAFDPVVVSATDGPLPPTLDQIQALKAQGATSIDIVITDTSLVDDAELLELVELEVRDLVEQNGLAVGSITRDPSGASGPSGIYGPPS